jgi:uncharacterized protein DUF2188
MTGHHLEVLPLSRHRWVVRYEGDSTPLAELPTQKEARAHARRTAGPRRIDPDFHAPTAKDVKPGPKLEP